jgi:hypothetical protein
MGICTFDAKKIAGCAKHAMSSSQWSMGYEIDKTPSPGLLFVHDQGVYCISNGLPVQPAAGREGCHAVYARGCDPHSGAAFDEWYGLSRDLVGGDDFAEVLLVDDEFLSLCEQNDEFCVDVQPTTLRAYFQRRDK